MEIPTCELFKKFEFLTVFDLYTYHVCVLMYKICNEQCPSYLTSLFKHVSRNTRYELRSFNEKNYVTPYPKLEHYKKSFAYSGSVLWNQLPDNLTRPRGLMLTCERIHLLFDLI